MTAVKGTSLTHPAQGEGGVARPRCEGCGNEIDPDTCGCGDPITHGAWSAGHTPIPMGCDCFRVVLASDYDALAASHAELASQLEDARQIAREAEDRLIANRFSRVEFAEVLWDQIAFLESGQFERLDVEAQISALRVGLSKVRP